MEYQEYLDKHVSYDNILARRCDAALLDYFIFYVITILYGYFFGEIREWRFDSTSFRVDVDSGFIPRLIIWIIYFPLVESILGYTLAKGLFDLKVIYENKNDFPFIASFKRHIVDIIDFFFFGIVAIILVAVTKEHKRIGDFFGRTKVILDK